VCCADTKNRRICLGFATTIAYLIVGFLAPDFCKYKLAKAYLLRGRHIMSCERKVCSPDEPRMSSKYHEIVLTQTALREISPEDSFLLSLEQGVSPRKNDVMIELGCGSGLRSLLLSKKYSLEPVLIDWAKAAISLSKENAHRLGVSCNLIRCELSRLPLRDAAFDIVWAEGTHEHLPLRDRLQAFRETRRIAKVGARTLIFVPNALNPFYRLIEFIKGRTGFAQLFDIPFTRSELVWHLTNSGFRAKAGDGLEVFYPLFTYSNFNLNDVPLIVRPIYRIKRFITRHYFGRKGTFNTVMRLLRRFDRNHLPRYLLGLQIGVVAEAV
jgi:hypothetical protein